ncbi:putative Lipase 2 [metagenome]|uniref:Putative Lipase 2 n=1 Tax=metagenome TaxID=256318 RepID=A0A2P2C359_9ZZZZ
MPAQDLRSPRRAGLATLVVAALLTALLAACSGTRGAPPPDSSGAPPTFTRYVALGDSYTAAPLVPELEPATGCFRSTRNYPALLVDLVTIDTSVDRSCSGADTPDLTRAQTTVAGRVPPQLAAVSPDTDLVTLGIGGNDFGVFATLIGVCTDLRRQDPTGSPCRHAMDDDGHDRLLTSLGRTQVRVTAAIRRIQRTAPEATIVVVGYPQIVPAQGTCPELLPLADGDYAYAHSVNHTLTLALHQAAAMTDSVYADVWSASEGHDICSQDPWINGQFTDFSLAQAYHPFAVEQAEVAELISRALGS